MKNAKHGCCTFSTHWHHSRRIRIHPVTNTCCLSWIYSLFIKIIASCVPTTYLKCYSIYCSARRRKKIIRTKSVRRESNKICANHNWRNLVINKIAVLGERRPCRRKARWINTLNRQFCVWKFVCERRHVYFYIHIGIVYELRSSTELPQCDWDGS